MSYERFYGQADDFDGWRCICCGDIVDDVILSNVEKEEVTPSVTVVGKTSDWNSRRKGIRGAREPNESYSGHT
jgi:hypothetical protein